MKRLSPELVPAGVAVGMAGPVAKSDWVHPPPKRRMTFADAAQKLEVLWHMHIGQETPEEHDAFGRECMECGVHHCPYGEPLHYHHDGCPCCD